MTKSLKDALRESITKKRAGLSREEAAFSAAHARDLFLAEPVWAAASQVALFVSVKNEINTGGLLEAAWAAGKKVFLPRIERQKRGVMHFAACAGPADLAPGAFGIPEPRPELCAACDFSGGRYPELFILPGLAFDRKGRRLGWGGGYYDRFLRRCAGKSKLVGFAYAFQLLPEVPAESWDLPVNAVCTDKEFLWIS